MLHLAISAFSCGSHMLLLLQLRMRLPRLVVVGRLLTDPVQEKMDPVPWKVWLPLQVPHTFNHTLRQLQVLDSYAMLKHLDSHVHVQCMEYTVCYVDTSAGFGKSPVVSLKKTKASPWAFFFHKTHFHVSYAIHMHTTHDSIIAERLNSCVCVVSLSYCLMRVLTLSGCACFITYSKQTDHFLLSQKVRGK